MDNILYLDDYINLYNKNKNKILTFKPYKKTLKNGLIIDREKFIKSFKKMTNLYNIKPKIFNENIYIVTNNLYNKEVKLLLEDILTNLNYKKISFISELDYLNVDKNTIYINCNYTYYYFLFRNMYGKINIEIYNNNEINNKNIKNIINTINKKNIIFYGKNVKEIIKYISLTYNYYIYENSDNLVLKKLIKIV